MLRFPSPQPLAGGPTLAVVLDALVGGVGAPWQARKLKVFTKTQKCSPRQTAFRDTVGARMRMKRNFTCRHRCQSDIELEDLLVLWRMRWALWTTVALCGLLAAYFASPLVALYQIGSAVEARDAAALEGRLVLPSIRRSFNRQIVEVYRKATGKPLPLGAMARRFALSAADPIVARLITVNALLDLLGKGEAGDAASVPIDRAPLTSNALGSVWQLWLSADYLGRTFYVHLPSDRARAKQFRVEMRLSNWRWRITGIDLPEDLKEQLARELVDLAEQKADRLGDR